MRSPRCEFRLCVWHAGVWHTDGRTDRQTESMRQHTASLRWSTHVRSVARWKRHKCINCVNKEHWLATEGATLAVRRVQNPVQAGTGDVHNPHTPLSRLPRRFCAGVQQWSGTDSSRHPAATTLYHGQERDLATEPSLWPVQLYGTVYQQQFVKLTSCIRSDASSKTHLFTLCFNDWLTVFRLL